MDDWRFSFLNAHLISRCQDLPINFWCCCSSLIMTGWRKSSGRPSRRKPTPVLTVQLRCTHGSCDHSGSTFGILTRSRSNFHNVGGVGPWLLWALFAPPLKVASRLKIDLKHRLNQGYCTKVLYVVLSV